MLDPLLLPPIAFFAAITLLGLIIGSFLNVVIIRLPVMLERDWFQQCKQFLSENFQIQVQANPFGTTERYNLLLPASHCTKCKTPIKIIDNIPVISYLLLKGRCRHCQIAVPIRYPLVECITALLSFVCAYHFGISIALLPALLFTWSLIALTMIDIDRQILPDNITLPLLWLGLLINIQSLYAPITDAILGVVLGYLSLWVIFWLFKLTTGKEGMGYGDFKLFAMLGAWSGYQALLPIILISSFLGALTGITLILLKKHQKGHPIPFGPFLAGAGWIVFLYGDKITDYYFKISGMPAL